MITRYFGLDVHKNYVVATAVDGEQQTLMPKERIPMDRFPEWVEQRLTRLEEVALEVTTNAWPVVDLIMAQAGRVVAVNPYKTKLIAEAKIKNVKVDADALAKLLAANFICEVWVPHARVRQQRSLAIHRAKLQQQCSAIKNSLHSILHRHNLRCPERSLFFQAGQDWLNSCQLPEPEGLRVRHLLRQLELLEGQREEADRQVARWASQDPRVPRSMQITGIGYFSAFAILAFIGNIERFSAPGKLTSYAGLVPRESQSGDHHYRGHITKSGHPLLRCLPCLHWAAGTRGGSGQGILVQAARIAVQWSPHWQRIHDRIARRHGTNIAIVAVARKMRALIWQLLTHKSTNRHLRPQTYVTKLQNWAYRIGRAHLKAASSKEFVYQHLETMGLHQVRRKIVTNRGNGKLRIANAQLPLNIGAPGPTVRVAFSRGGRDTGRRGTWYLRHPFFPWIEFRKRMVP